MKLILMSYKNTLLKLVYYLQLESHATPILAFAIHLEVYYFHICIVMPLLLKSFLFILLIPQKQCNCILQEYTRLTLPAHWNSCWSARYWYANALISTFRLHLTLNRTEIGSRSHVSAADVTRVFEIHGFSNHTSVYSSSFRRRLFRDTARKAQPQFAHFTHQVDPDRCWPQRRVFLPKLQT